MTENTTSTDGISHLTVLSQPPYFSQTRRGCLTARSCSKPRAMQLCLAGAFSYTKSDPAVVQQRGTADGLADKGLNPQVKTVLMLAITDSGYYLPVAFQKHIRYTKNKRMFLLGDIYERTGNPAR